MERKGEKEINPKSFPLKRTRIWIGGSVRAWKTEGEGRGQCGGVVGCKGSVSRDVVKV